MTVHALLTLGVVLLAAGFVGAPTPVMIAATAALGTAMGIFVTTAAMVLLRVSTWGDTGRAIALALVALAVSSVLGLILAIAHTGALPLLRHWTDLHLGWGLAGWVPLLVMAVAFQVVPMFQMTPAYPRWLSAGLPITLFALLVTYLVLGLAGAPRWATVTVEALIAAALAVFAIVTLLLQQRRRRRMSDVTVDYWRLGMGAILLATLLWAAAQVRADAFATAAWYPTLLGTIMILGFAMAVINGMLYKIVPFLVWLHMSTATRAQAIRVPTMRQIISQQRARRQFLIYLLALLLSVAGLVWLPALLLAAAAALFLASALLCADMLSALTTYRRVLAAHAPAEVAS